MTVTRYTKGQFPYEYIPAHASTCRGMHVHAVLSLKVDGLQSAPHERVSQ